MSDKNLQKPTLDKDLAKVVHLEQASGYISKGYAGQGIAPTFLALVGVIAAVLTEGYSGS